jgi:hypothetical protein
MDDEYAAFVAFANSSTRYPIMPFYAFDHVLLQKTMQIYRHLFAYNLPELCEHFELEKIMPRNYLFQWFMTMFSRTFGIKLTTRVWDLYLIDGVIVLFQSAIAILRMLESQMLDAEFEDILPMLSKVHEHITEEDEDEFIKNMYQVSFPKWVYDEIPILEAEF